MSDASKVAIVISSQKIGQGDPELGRRLLVNFLHALEAERRFPGVICFLNEGVRLVTHGSPVLTNLKTLEALGVNLLVCRTCLEFYGLTDQVAVGTIGNMAGVVAALFQAESVINL
ncbi:MAG: sulfurtransferase-like selenium metabolism protein YedF [Armatimonadota bacterium]|nr:sulfurtransferase-like selenium metabolism protein YedF [Armatimonadota bacterium]